MGTSTLTDTNLQSDTQSTKDKVFKIVTLCVPVLMGILIFFNPMPHTTAIKEICFYGSVIIVLILIYFKRVKFSLKSPLTLPFALFTAWVFIGIFFALDRENSIHDFISHLLKYIVMYFIIINFFNSRKRLVGLSWVIIISAAIFSIGEIFYFYYMLGNSFSTKLVTGLSEIPVNWVGYITVSAIIFASHQIFIRESSLSVKTISFVALFPLFSLSLLTQTRSTLIALFLSIVVLFYKKKKIMIFFVGILVIFTTMSPVKDRFLHTNLITSLRLDIHATTLEIIKDFAVMGIGFGMETYRNDDVINLETYNKKVPEKYRQPAIHNDPHSMLPSIAVRAGLVGLVLFLCILFTSCRMCWSCIRHGKDDFIRNWGSCIAGVLVVVFVIGIFEPFFSHAPEVLFYLVLGMITILWQFNQGVSSKLNNFP